MNSKDVTWDMVYKKNLHDKYSAAAVQTAKRVMDWLDKNPDVKLKVGQYPDLNTPHGILVSEADKVIKGNISGLQASFAVGCIEKFHPRGKEFARLYYKH